MNILITRPLIDAEDLMAKLFSLGHKIIHLPTLKIIPAKLNPIDFKQFNALIFTSANAIRNLKSLNRIKVNYVFVLALSQKKLQDQKDLIILFPLAEL